MAAASVAVTRPAHAPALTRSSACRAATGRDSVHATSPGRKTRWLASAQQQRGRGQQDEPGPDDAESIEEDAEQQGREEPAQASERADETGHRAGVLREVLRHQLEDGAVAQPHQHRAPERADRERHHGPPRQEQREQGDTAEHPREDLGAADPVRQPSADRPHQRREHDESSGSEAGVGGSQAELRPQQRRQVDRERHEAAEGEEVEGAEQPGGRLAAQDRDHRGDRGGTPGLRRIPRQQEVRRPPMPRSIAPVPWNTTSQPRRAATTGPTKTASDCPIVPRP